MSDSNTLNIGDVEFNPMLRVAPLTPTKISDGPLQFVEPRCFTCTLQTASMFTPAGTKIPFLNGFLRTEIAAIIAHLDAEVDAGNEFIKRATPDEIRANGMLVNPRAIIEEEMRERIELEVRANFARQLEAEIRAQIADEHARSTDAAAAVFAEDASTQVTAQVETPQDDAAVAASLLEAIKSQQG